MIWKTNDEITWALALGVSLEDLHYSLEQMTQKYITVRRTMQIYGELIYALALEQYQQCHTVVPGSNRTKRLRKKRRKAVLDWYSKQLEIE